MSDNLSKDACDREINAYLDLPAELFTDIFKLLTRCELVQHVEPVNKAFKAICDENIKSIHVIKRAEEFFRKLEKGDPEANQQVEDLSGHNCALAGQFVIGAKSLWLDINYSKSRAIQSVLRHSMDLFQRCQIQLEDVHVQLISAQPLAYLTVLEPAKPVFIRICIYPEESKAKLSTLLRHPTILNCLRLRLVEWGSVWARDHGQPIFDWLHHNPMDNNMLDVDSSCIVDVVDQQKQPDIRCLMLLRLYYNHEPVLWMLDRCVQNLQQSRVPSDQRHFLFAFQCSNELDVNELNRFARIENASTGEVLLLERVLGNPQWDDYPCYRLVRCLASQIANGTEELYAKLFNADGEFDIETDEHGMRGRDR